MLLKTREAMVYANISKPTLHAAKLPHTPGERSGWKLYDTEHLDEAFPSAPKVLPAKQITSTPPQEMPPFVVTGEVQEAYDNIVTIVEGHSEDLSALDNLVESLLRVRHYKAWYHAQVEADPMNTVITKLLSQTIRDEILILKALKVSP